MAFQEQPECQPMFRMDGRVVRPGIRNGRNRVGFLNPTPFNLSFFFFFFFLHFRFLPIAMNIANGDGMFDSECVNVSPTSFQK